VKHRKRAFEVFTLSFLDCICCGFGAVILFYMIVSAQNGAQEIRKLEELTGEVSKLDEEVKRGTRNLVQLRNALEATETDKASAAERLARIKNELQERRDQAAAFENDSLARREHINQLKADIRALEEGTKRLQGGALDKAPAGDRVKAFRGKGDRRYITALRMKGKRILVLLDTSASMMEEDVVKVIKLRNQPEAARRATQKWRRSLDIVEWITAQLPDNSQFQVYGFNSKTRAVLPDTHERSARHQQRGPRGAWHHAHGRHQSHERLAHGEGHGPRARPDHPHHRRPADAGHGAARAQVHQRARPRETLRRRDEDGDARPAHRRGAHAHEGRPARRARLLAARAPHAGRVRHSFAGLAMRAHS
jgi:hypothetical protein